MNSLESPNDYLECTIKQSVRRRVPSVKIKDELSYSLFSEHSAKKLQLIVDDLGKTRAALSLSRVWRFPMEILINQWLRVSKIRTL